MKRTRLLYYYLRVDGATRLTKTTYNPVELLELNRAQSAGKIK